MAELKTKKNTKSVEEYIAQIPDDTVKADCKLLSEMMAKSTGDKGSMWGESIVGFGTYHYKYASGREGDWFQVGFSPRKQNLTIYLAYGFEKYKDQLNRLGKHKTGKACLYVKNLTRIDKSVLQELIDLSVRAIRTGNS